MTRANYLNIIRLMVCTKLITLCTFMFIGCETASESSLAGEGYATDEEQKYQGELSDTPENLNIPSNAINLGEVWVTMEEGEYKKYRFSKEAGYTYFIGLTELTGDMDLYGHWTSQVSRSVAQYKSWNWGVEDEQLNVVSTKDGDYFVAIHGYESGTARLVLFRAENTDEVGWPVDWWSDSGHSDTLGGYQWLDQGNYGSGCGWVYHPGIDMNSGSSSRADYGKPVYSVANGMVIKSHNYGGGWGKVILIKHTLNSGLTFWSQYGHLKDMNVQEGDQVSRGQSIGSVGDAEGKWSPHLHFEIRSKAKKANSFPCGWASHSVEGDYIDPEEFIKTH